MLRNIIALVCLLGATNAIAQSGKITEKESATEIDYKLMGAPMPSLFAVIYHDSAVLSGGAVNESRPNQKGKRKKVQAEVTNKPMVATYVSDKDLDNGANLFVMMFNPTCSHCEDQTIQFERNISLFKKSKIVLLANTGMKEYLPDFIRSLHVDNYPPIMAGTDSSGFIGHVFLYSALPQINVYDSQRKLLKTYTGGAPMDSLKQYIQ